MPAQATAFTRDFLAPLTGAIGVPLWAVQLTDGWHLSLSCLLGWSLLALALIDLRRFLLPDLLTLPLLVAGLGIACLHDRATLVSALTGAAAGFIAFAVIREAYWRLRRREGLGFGDVKLLAALGAWLGWISLPSVVLIACLSALAATCLSARFGRLVAADQKLAFGAHLALGGWLVWLYGPLGLP